MNVFSPYKQRGFTLIELILVIAIVGILAAIAIPAYQEMVMRAKVSEGLVLLSDRKVAISEYYDQHKVMPADLADIGWADSGNNRPFTQVFGFPSEIFDRVMVTRRGGGRYLELRLRSYAMPELNGQRINLFLQAKADAEATSFRCIVNEDPESQRWVPGNCRTGRRNQWNW